MNRTALVSECFLESSGTCTHHSFSYLKHLKIPNSRLHGHRSQLRDQEPFLAGLTVTPKFLKPGSTGRAI